MKWIIILNFSIKYKSSICYNTNVDLLLKLFKYEAVSPLYSNLFQTPSSFIIYNTFQDAIMPIPLLLKIYHWIQ